MWKCLSFQNKTLFHWIKAIFKSCREFYEVKKMWEGRRNVANHRASLHMFGPLEWKMWCESSWRGTQSDSVLAELGSFPVSLREERSHRSCTSLLNSSSVLSFLSPQLFFPTSPELGWHEKGASWDLVRQKPYFGSLVCSLNKSLCIKRSLYGLEVSSSCDITNSLR